MSPTPKKKRHGWQPVALPEKRGKAYAYNLTNRDYVERFAAILTQFEHLESRMPLVLAVLLGVPDERIAGYVYRALRSPNLRLEVMRDLLQKSPNNVELGPEYDQILAEYDALRSARNGYVHGLWFTETTTGEVLLAKRDEHGFAFLAAQEEPITSLIDVQTRIAVLRSRVDYAVQADFDQGRSPPGDPAKSEPNQG